MFLRRTERKKNGKTHIYWNVVENKRIWIPTGALGLLPTLKASVPKGFSAAGDLDRPMAQDIDSENASHLFALAGRTTPASHFS